MATCTTAVSWPLHPLLRPPVATRELKGWLNFTLLVLQIEFPPAPRGEEAAWGVLKQVVRGCLRVDPTAITGRIQTGQAQQELFDFMQLARWSDDVSAIGTKRL